MADEFVDFYEILELPLEAERSEIRKRISEIYVEAQKNLDHRNFDTRVRYQQLFEVTLPQARYILLDDERRDDYDRLVRASRAPFGAASSGASATAATSSGEAKPQTSRGSRLAPNSMLGEAPNIGALPDVSSDPAAVAREREELWNKWKSGLQNAMEREIARENKVSGVATTPLADRIEAVQKGAPQPRAGASHPQSAAPPPRTERPRVKFDFGGGESEESPLQGDAPASGAPNSAAPASSVLSPQQLEERRIDHRREIIREELENTGVKANLIGAALVLVPGIIAMTIFMSAYYPPDKVSVLPIKNSAIAWLLWLIILAGLAYCGAYFLSKSLRRKQALQLQLMSYEELVRHTHKDI